MANTCDSSYKSKSPQASLSCVQTLRAPRIKKSFISDADELLTSYADKHDNTCQSPVWSCSWSQDGKLLATCHGRPDPCIRLWAVNHSSGGNNGEGWTLVATLRDNEGDESSRTIRSVSFAPVPNNSRKILATASFDGTVSIWEDFSNEKNIMDSESHTACGWECTAQLEGHENEVKDVAWNETGTLLASCGRDKSVWIWECFLPGSIGGDGNGSAGKSGGDGDFECLAVLQSHTGDVKSIVFAPSHGQFGDGDEILLSASYDDTIKCWAEDAGDWYCALTLSGVHTSTIWSIAVSPGGVRMVSGSGDQSLAIYRCYTASEKNELDEDHDGMHSDGIWKCVGRLPSAHKDVIYSVDCAPAKAGHGRIVSGGGDKAINVYREFGGSPDAPKFSLDASVDRAHEGDVNCVKWHPLNGKILASVGDDGLIKIWSYSSK